MARVSGPGPCSTSGAGTQALGRTWRGSTRREPRAAHRAPRGGAFSRRDSRCPDLPEPGSQLAAKVSDPLRVAPRQWVAQGRPHLHELGSTLEREHSRDLVALSVKEQCPVGRAVDPQLLGASAVAGELDPHTVLVGPEVRN